MVNWRPGLTSFIRMQESQNILLLGVKGCWLMGRMSGTCHGLDYFGKARKWITSHIDLDNVLYSAGLNQCGWQCCKSGKRHTITMAIDFLACNGNSLSFGPCNAKPFQAGVRKRAFRRECACSEASIDDVLNPWKVIEKRLTQHSSHAKKEPPGKVNYSGIVLLQTVPWGTTTLTLKENINIRISETLELLVQSNHWPGANPLLYSSTSSCQSIHTIDTVIKSEIPTPQACCCEPYCKKNLSCNSFTIKKGAKSSIQWPGSPKSPSPKPIAANPNAQNSLSYNPYSTKTGSPGSKSCRCMVRRITVSDLAVQKLWAICFDGFEAF